MDALEQMAKVREGAGEELEIIQYVFAFDPREVRGGCKKYRTLTLFLLIAYLRLNSYVGQNTDAGGEGQVLAITYQNSSNLANTHNLFSTFH